jgi:phosphatidylserine decarboxylase
MRIHREGYSILLLAGSVLAVMIGLMPRRWRLTAAGFGLMVMGFLLQFFRHPRRQPPQCTDCVLSPADGVVVAVERVYEDEFLHEPRLKIAIFMRVIDVHVNRSPVAGRLIYYQYHPGQYLMAFHPKSSALNERNTIVIERPDGQRVLLRQIAGILARRICFYLQPGQAVAAGQELGFIRFGSRCDIYLPLDADVRVRLQQVVRAGETVIARL